MKLKRTPQLSFEADPAVAHGERVEAILRAIHSEEAHSGEAHSPGPRAGRLAGGSPPPGGPGSPVPGTPVPGSQVPGRWAFGPAGRATGVSPVDGLAVIDKPAGCTSHDVVARCRRIFGQRKVGHAGTLDPDATGLLLVGLGQATRLLRWLTGLPKRYSGEVVLGQATNTLDASGDVTGTWDMRAVTLDAARAAAARLTGEVTQVPPMFSAVKVGGRRLHELARAGVEVDRSARQVHIKRFDVTLVGAEEPGPVLAIDVECSSGTYVRTLAADLGTALGGGAYLRHLRRTAVGDFTLQDAVTLEDLEGRAGTSGAVLAPVEALRGMSRAMVDEAVATRVRYGQVIPLELLREAGASGTGPGPCWTKTETSWPFTSPSASGPPAPPRSSRRSSWSPPITRSSRLFLWAEVRGAGPVLIVRRRPAAWLCA